MTKPLLLALNGSPVPGSSTEILLNEFCRGARLAGFAVEWVDLNRQKIMPCQSCGESPEPKLCFFDDDMTPLYEKFLASRFVVVGSPIYFDSVSAQVKLFIDRMNCVRPMAEKRNGEVYLKKRNLGRRGGFVILVGGEDPKFQGALWVVKGFFIWAGTHPEGHLLYSPNTFEAGLVQKERKILKVAFEKGKRLALKWAR
ncbi:MAG: flavodoxin family protein [candidate division Zixibacteria bacterium]|nr:flavodoxin family protein [candidate division Zixibacteria bacterium]MCI0596903.1 flavodoxin family protein [candidate division Zixibacteria bacterium]